MHPHECARPRQVQQKHREDDARLALAHVELSNGTGAVNEVLSCHVLHPPDLELLLNFEDQPLWVYLHLPFAPDLFELTLELLCVVFFGELAHAL